MASIFRKMIKKSAANIPPRRLVNPARLLFLVALVPTIMALAGCAARNKAYPGPKLDNSEVGIVVPGIESGFKTKYIAILQINDQEEMEEWSGGGSQPIYLLPGDYRFRVEYKQTTQGTTVSIVDLVTVVQDMAQCC